jgi:hypothetical protein
MSTYEAISLMISFAMFTIMLISLVVSIIKAINKDK